MTSPTPVVAPRPDPGDVGLPTGTGDPVGVPARRRMESVVARKMVPSGPRATSITESSMPGIRPGTSAEVPSADRSAS
jgi:hypothetical protein